MSGFYNSVKSTVDKLGNDIAGQVRADNPGLDLIAINLDATSGVEEALASSKPGIVWQVTSLVEAPADPLYSLGIMVGVKTTGDVSNQLMSSLIAVVQATLPAHTNINVMDYSGVAVPTAVEGRIFVTRAAIEEQEFDKTSGLRMLAVQSVIDRVPS